FGASGRTGRQLVEQAVAEGHQVTAIVRNPDGLASDLHGAVRLVKADAMDPNAIAPALADADAVVSALTGPGREPSSVCSGSTRSIAGDARGERAAVHRHHGLDARRNRRRPLLPLHRQTDRAANVEGIRERYHPLFVGHGNQLSRPDARARLRLLGTEARAN